MTLASCPFDKSHRVEVLEMALHIEACRLFHPGVRKVQCEDHVVSIENYPTHLIVCSSNRDGPLQTKKKPKKPPKTNGDVFNAPSSLKNNQPKKKPPIADHFYPPVLLTEISGKSKQKSKNAIGKQNKDIVNKSKSVKVPKAKNKKPQKRVEAGGSPQRMTWYEELEETLPSRPCVKINPIPESLIFEPDYLKKSETIQPKASKETSPSDINEAVYSGARLTEDKNLNTAECVPVQKDKSKEHGEVPPCMDDQDGEKYKLPQNQMSGEHFNALNKVDINANEINSPLKFGLDERFNEENSLEDNSLNSQFSSRHLKMNTFFNVNGTDGFHEGKHSSSSHVLNGVPGDDLENKLSTESDSMLLKKDNQPLQREPIQQEPIQQEPIQQEPIQQEPIQQEPIQQEPIQQEPIQQEPLYQDQLYQKPLHLEPLHQDPLHQDPPHQDPLQDLLHQVNDPHSLKDNSAVDGLMNITSLTTEFDNSDGHLQADVQPFTKTTSTLNPECAPFELKIPGKDNERFTMEPRPSLEVALQQGSGDILSLASASGNSAKTLTNVTMKKIRVEEDTNEVDASNGRHTDERNIVDRNELHVRSKMKDCEKGESQIFKLENSNVVLECGVVPFDAVYLPPVNPFQFSAKVRNIPPPKPVSLRTKYQYGNELTIVQDNSTPLEQLKIAAMTPERQEQYVSVGEEVHRTFEKTSPNKSDREQNKRVSEAEGREEGMDTICSDDVFESESAHLVAHTTAAVPNNITALLANTNLQRVHHPDFHFEPTGGYMHYQADADFTTNVPIPCIQEFDVPENCMQGYELVSNEVHVVNKTSIELAQEIMGPYEDSNADWKVQMRDNSGIVSEEQGALPEGAVIDFNDVIYIPYGEIEMPVKPEHTSPCEIRLKRMPVATHRDYQNIRKEVINLNKMIRKLSSPEIAEFERLRARLKKTDDLFEDYLNDYLNFRA
ncbi:TRM13/UPF0224 family U11-48K-like CHHC zinc finger domain [Trinorchestia longiramus]|nr:TRM13/UPF0224 family U11-48K-like CHHC zinc finger domain [Trinorchestia longiramus]